MHVIPHMELILSYTIIAFILLITSSLLSKILVVGLDVIIKHLIEE